MREHMLLNRGLRRLNWEQSFHEWSRCWSFCFNCETLTSETLNMGVEEIELYSRTVCDPRCVALGKTLKESALRAVPDFGNPSAVTPTVSSRGLF